jgi:hypothetical protein
MYMVPRKSEGKIILYSTFFKEQGYGKQEQSRISQVNRDK